MYVPDRLDNPFEREMEDCPKCGGCGKTYEWWKPAFDGQEEGDYKGRKCLEISEDEYFNMTPCERADVEIRDCPDCRGNGVVEIEADVAEFEYEYND